MKRPKQSSYFSHLVFTRAARALAAALASAIVLGATPSFASDAHSSSGIQVQVENQAGGHEPVARLKSKSAVTGIIAAGSTYADLSAAAALPEASGGTSGVTNVVGSASLVQIGSTSRVLVMTAAHVVAGVHPWVQIGDRKISVRASWIDNDADVAILDPGPITAEPAFSYTIDAAQRELKVTPKLMEQIDKGRAPIVMLAYYLPGHALGFALRPWVDPGVETAHARGVMHAPIVSMSHDGEQIRIYTKVTSGASGSAVFDLRGQSVAGLIVQSHYYLSETYLASAAVVQTRFDEFLGGARGSRSATVWRMHNGLEYRIFAGGVSETDFINRPTGGTIGQPGNGSIGQPGNGSIGQPGNGSIGQPGNGSIGQPGNGSIGQPGNGSIGQPGGPGTIGQPGKDGADPSGEETAPDPALSQPFQPWTQSPQAVFDHFKIRPGMVVGGESFIGLKVEAKTENANWPQKFTLLAEGEALKFMRTHKAEFKFQPILSRSTDLLSALRERLQVTASESAVVKAAFGPSAVADDLETPSEPDACTLSLEPNSVRVKVKTYSSLDRKTWKLIPDELEFSLGRNGSLEAGKPFLPVIEVRSKSGELYYVDLRQFYFGDLSQVMRPMPDWSDENPPFDRKRFDPVTQLKTVGLSVRNARSGAEFTYGFLPPEPVQAPKR